MFVFLLVVVVVAAAAAAAAAAGHVAAAAAAFLVSISHFHIAAVVAAVVVSFIANLSSTFRWRDANSSSWSSTLCTLQHFAERQCKGLGFGGNSTWVVG